jgi:hypothetical protein
MKLFDFGLIIFVGLAFYVAAVIHDQEKDRKEFHEKMLQIHEANFYR